MNGSHDSLELWANAIDSIRFDGDASALIELLLSRSMPMQVQSKLADLFDPADPGVSPHVLKPIRQKRSIQILKTIHKKLSTGYRLLYKTAGRSKVDAAVLELEIQTGQSRSALHAAYRDVRMFQTFFDYHLLSMPREQFERIDEAYKAGGFAAMAAALDAVEFFDPENPPPIAGPPLRDIRELRCIWIVHYNLWARRHAAKNPSDDRRGKVRGRRKSRTRG